MTPTSFMRSFDKPTWANSIKKTRRCTPQFASPPSRTTLYQRLEPIIPDPSREAPYRESPARMPPTPLRKSILDFNTEREKGINFGCDTSREGQHSKTRVLDGKSNDFTVGGDWMVQAMLTKPELDP